MQDAIRHCRTLFRRTLPLLIAALCCVGCEEEGTAELAILDIQPREGAMQGQQAVDITGQGFRRDMGYTVYFGPHAAESVIIVSDQQMRVSTPQFEETQTVDVLIRADDGTAFRIHDGYTFQALGAGMGDGTGMTDGPAKLPY